MNPTTFEKIDLTSNQKTVSEDFALKLVEIITRKK